MIMKKRVVKQENIGKAFISTVRLPEAYTFNGLYPMQKFETMITYNEEWLDYQERCGTLKEAREQHQKAKLFVIEKYGDDKNE